jgi:hypothetical protein
VNRDLLLYETREHLPVRRMPLTFPSLLKIYVPSFVLIQSVLPPAIHLIILSSF